ncbi:hypothetical protein PILCRDRAFT_818055 [Piloderma croceum F 1598]|uniref:Uncharacterized protein n=1 Tax=Piloderma croceum (strain F 1598) TaxID=765440 RepID=A0A0C3FXY5_PILCF|nr:hypothetical protein PILCRDRAFT_818055 [Piloderma croceum F 1598]
MLLSFTVLLFVSLCISFVNGVVLDRKLESPANASHTNLFRNAPITPPTNTTLSHPSRSLTAVAPHNLPPIANSKPIYANFKRDPSPSVDDALDSSPTPAPTGSRSPLTTVHITDESDFALLLPKTPHELISDAESDGVAYCSKSGCSETFPEGLITGAAVKKAADGSWIQVTGCLNPSLFPFAAHDDGGQFDVRFPDGAQCTFGGYGASFIEQVEPTASRFCLRCCSTENDQDNCNSHQDTAGCLVVIPGTYTFGNVDCST